MSRAAKVVASIAVDELTERQREILRFITKASEERGFPPTIREIGEEMDISSTNGVNDHLKALERKGFLQRTEQTSFLPQKETDRRIIAVYFDKGRKVERLANYGMKDGKLFDYISRTTPSGGEQQSVLGFFVKIVRPGG